jgi:hypothetical protein
MATRYCLINSGRVVEVFDDEPVLHPALTVIQTDDANIAEGWSYNRDTAAFAPPAPPAPAPLPTIVTSAQAKIQLLRSQPVAGGKTLLDDVTSVIQAVGGEAQIWFSDARVWERTNPYVLSLSKEIKLSSEEVDNLFFSASIINA